MSPSDGLVLVVAGEPSGDLHAGRLLEALAGEMPGLRAVGMGGEAMRKAGAEIIHDYGSLAVVGISDFPRVLPVLRRIKRDLLNQVRERRPRAVILVDYPGFNLSFAKALKKLPNPPRLIYFIPPQVWAWGSGRARTIARIFDLVLTIYPFEPPYFTRSGGQAEYTGNPVAFGLRNRPTKREARASLGIPQDAQVVSFLPGSRLKEIERHIPPMEEAVRILKERCPEVLCLISEAGAIPEGTIRNALSSEEEGIRVIRGRQHEVIRAADAAAVASGTATLETGLLGTPMIIIYIVELVTYLLAMYFLVRVDYIGLVNLLAGREVAPELHQGKVRGRRIADLLSSLLEDPDARQRQIQAFDEIRDFLAGPDPYARAAGRIRRFLEGAP